METRGSGSPGPPGAKTGWEATVDATLRRLGVSLDASVRDADTAVAQGFAAASVVLGHRVLEGGNPDQAIAAFDGAILSLQGRRHVSLAPLLAVAHYLRGVAYEAKGLAAEALEDYTKALALTPQHKGALAARDRLSRTQPGP